jgi:hypothetical protein
MNDLDHQIDAHLLEEFLGNVSGSQKLLFLRLAERVQEGNIHETPELRDWLVSAFLGISEGEQPSKAMGFVNRGRPSESFAVWIKAVAEVAIIRAVSDLPLRDAQELVANRLPLYGTSLGFESVKRYWRLHSDKFSYLTRDTVHEYISWVSGRYETMLGFRAEDLGASAIQIQEELRQRVI